MLYSRSLLFIYFVYSIFVYSKFLIYSPINRHFLTSHICQTLLDMLRIYYTIYCEVKVAQSCPTLV